MPNPRPWSRAVLAALVLAVLPLSLEAMPGSTPVSFTRNVLSDEAIDHRFLRFVDVAYLRFEDEMNAQATGPDRVPFRVAEPIPVGLSLDEAGTRETLAGGGTLWRIRFSSPEAVFLSFNLRQVSLPPGAEMRFYAVERDWQDGPYTSRINNPERRFGSPAIPGDSAVLELYVPARTPWDPTLEIESVSHGYHDFNSFGRVPFRNGPRSFLDAARRVAKAMVCEVDVNCPEGSQWQADKRAVARTYDGRYLCTGALINNARQDCKPYFLTAAHCVSRSQSAAGLTFYWNYEKSGCGSGTAPAGQTSSGSYLRATNANSDFSLLELHTRPNSAYNTYYAGFSRSASAPSAGIAIHHPAGDVKKISFENDPVADGGNYGGGWGNDHWRILGWDTGTTEGGSSGCPLFNPSHQIVGQLHGGTADCTGGWDEFGKLAVSWGAGLSGYLDPDNTGLTSLGGKESSTCTGGGTCLPAGSACTSNAQCCSGTCAKKTRTCR